MPKALVFAMNTTGSLLFVKTGAASTVLHRSSNSVKVLDLISQGNRHRSIGNPRKVVNLSLVKGISYPQSLPWDHKRQMIVGF